MSFQPESQHWAHRSGEGRQVSSFTLKMLPAILKIGIYIVIWEEGLKDSELRSYVISFEFQKADSGRFDTGELKGGSYSKQRNSVLRLSIFQFPGRLTVKGVQEM